jgi:hypothetical protein
MTRYYTEVSRELLAQPMTLPEGFRIIGEHLDVINPRDIWTAVMEVEDDGAPPELEGKLVEVTLQQHADDTVTVLERNVVVCGASTDDPTEPGATCALSPHASGIQHESANSAFWRRALS